MAVKSEEGNHNDVPVTVEFKFRSCKTSLLEEEGQMTGTLHALMLQDPRTGRFRTPAGMTQAQKKKAKFTGYIRFQGHYMGRHFENAFTATFERPDKNSPIESFKLGHRPSGEQDESGCHPCLLNSEDECDRDRDGHFCNEFQTYPMKRKRIMKTLSGRLTTKKLYTTLSAQSANETNNLKIEHDAVPQWDRLEQLMTARFPEHGGSWSKSAAKNVIYFLDLKKGHNDWISELFSPSKWIDEVWHAHLKASRTGISMT